MEMDREIALTPSQERLLQRYFDGDCGWWAKTRAESLLSSSPAATAFLSSLGSCSETVRLWSQAAPAGPLNFWSSISSRIQQEERAEIFLGRRSLAEGSGWGEKVSGWTWGLSGAALAASAAVFAAVLLQDPIAPRQERAGGLGSDRQSFAAVEAAASGALPEQVPQLNYAAHTIQPREPARRAGIVEVEWIRSSGRVRMIQQSNQGAPIIWVRQQALVERQVINAGLDMVTSFSSPEGTIARPISSR